MSFSRKGALSLDDAKARFFEMLAHYDQYGFGKLAIISKKSHKIIGYCGFEKCLLDGRSEVELGFRLVKNERGRGYAFEAATALLKEMKSRNFKHVIAFSEQQNFPAHHLLNKLDFTETSTSSFLNMDVIFFSKKL